MEDDLPMSQLTFLSRATFFFFFVHRNLTQLYAEGSSISNRFIKCLYVFKLKHKLHDRFHLSMFFSYYIIYFGEPEMYLTWAVMLWELGAVV